MDSQHRIVDNRVFLLGLDELYRFAMESHERNELLACARDVTRVLSIRAADVPAEGYYSKSQQLAEYFRLMRELQAVSIRRLVEVRSLVGYQRLKQVTESGIFGTPADNQCLLPSTQDPLTVALERAWPQWTIQEITKAAYEVALDSEDFSLVSLAAIALDPVALAALRESIVLYAESVAGCASFPPAYSWEVDEVLNLRAERFIATFNALFSDSLPEPSQENARVYWQASQCASVLGRCVRLGFDRRAPTNHYHWAIDKDTQHQLIVNDFWDTQIWCTSRYQD